MSRSRIVALGASFGLLIASSCSDRERPPAFDGSLADGGREPASGEPAVGGLDVSQGGGESESCGKQEIRAVTDPPNLYFVVDRSGSMADKLPGSGYSKYENALVAMSVMLRAVGHRVRYGAATFPSSNVADGCLPGQQVFPTSDGDPPSYAARGENGPTLTRLLKRLGSSVPGGGTPTAQSLRALEPTVFALDGKKTYVVLMTDGAPNCNLDLSCGVDACIPNIEHTEISGSKCDELLNCCDAKKFGPIGVGYCVDADESEGAVLDYAAVGIDTFVVGMPGSEAYRALLGRLAHAGHTAREGDTAYYAVADTDELTEALLRIGAEVAIGCDLPLAQVPEDPALVNVYFDDEVVPQNAKNGWRYTGNANIRFDGQACDELREGKVLNVRVLAGCPTVIR